MKLNPVKINKSETSYSGLRQLHRYLAAEASQPNNKHSFLLQDVNLKDPFVS